MPVVVASEPGNCLNRDGVKAGRRCHCGVARLTRVGCRPPGLTNQQTQDVWKASPQTVTAGKVELGGRPDQFLSSTGHEQSGVKLGGPPPKARYTQRPIVHSTVRER